jgi:hypothetical protein
VSWLAVACVFALLAWPLVVSVRRATELFVVRVRAGRTRFVRGRMPQELLNEIAEVVASPEVASAELRVVRRSGEPELSLRGSLGPGQEQRLRNVIARFPVARIMAGGRPRRR